MQFIKFILLSSLLLVSTAFGQSKLPACKGSDTTKWSNCIGTATFENSVYVGQWKGGKSHGQGTETFANGNKYVGDYKDDKKSGQGTYLYANGDKHVGEYKDDKKTGQGTFTWADGEKYVGEWKDDSRNGQGTYTWTNGDKYVGEYKDGKMHGQGAYYYLANNEFQGDKYVGEYKDDKKRGQGTYTFADGKRREGIWEDGKFIREAKVNLPSSNTNTAKSEVKEQRNFLLDLCVVNNIDWQKFKCNKYAAQVSDEFSVLFQTFKESTTTLNLVFGSKCLNGPMPSSCANKQYVVDATYDLLQDSSIIQYTHAHGCSIPNKFILENGLLYQDYAGDATGTCAEQQLNAVKRIKELGKRRIYFTKN
jgi:hypothetical protein